MNPIQHLHLPAHMRHHGPAPLAENERRVEQFGTEWLEHAQSGGAIRNGNILVTEDAA